MATIHATIPGTAYGRSATAIPDKRLPDPYSQDSREQLIARLNAHADTVHQEWAEQIYMNATPPDDLVADLRRAAFYLQYPEPPVQLAAWPQLESNE